MRDQNQSEWTKAVAGDPVAAQFVTLQTLVKTSGSAMAQRRTFEAQLIAQASLSSTVSILYGEATSALKRLVVPSGKAAFIREINYHVEANGGGDPTADDLATKLKLEVDGEELAQLPEFALSEFARGTAGSLFGVVPLDLVVPPGGNLKLSATPPNAGSSTFDLYVTLLLRFEPLWLAEKLGLIDVSSP